MDISAVVKSLVLESVKDPEIRKAIGEISQDYIQDANTDAVHDWCDSNATDKITSYLQSESSLNDAVSEAVSNLTFDVSVS